MWQDYKHICALVENWTEIRCTVFLLLETSHDFVTNINRKTEEVAILNSVAVEYECQQGHKTTDYMAVSACR